MLCTERVAFVGIDPLFIITKSVAFSQVNGWVRKDEPSLFNYMVSKVYTL